MDVLWPGFAPLLGTLPFLIALYIVILRRRRRFVVRYSSLSLVREALPRSNWRRHLPFALFLLGLASLVGAMARPVAAVSVPTNQTTIILALDVSRSMCSTDIAPNRLAVAKATAQSFLQRQLPGTQIGIVAFASYAEIVQPPTTDRKTLERAVDSLITGGRTAIGSGILRSIDAIAEIDQNVAPSVTGTSGGPRPTPVPKGTYAPDIIVLLTDGSSNSGPTPLEAAQQAADRGIRVYTIGFGTEKGSEFPICDPQFQGSEPFAGGFPGGGGGGGRFRRGIDEATLRQVAERTNGEYYAAESAGELEEVFNRLPTNLITKTETIEISVAFAALGALLAALAITLSLSWHPFP